MTPQQALRRRSVQADPTRERILAVVTKMLESGGTDAVQLAAVAKGAKVSLRTVYEHFGSRDRLILEAVEAWMEANVYQPITEPNPGNSLFDALMWQFRHIFGPWEQYPHMAKAFMRARVGPDGHRLSIQGNTAVVPISGKLLKDVDRDFAEDLTSILTNVVYALVFRFATGELQVTDIMPTVERTLRRLTATPPQNATSKTAV